MFHSSAGFTCPTGSNLNYYPGPKPAGWALGGKGNSSTMTVGVMQHKMNKVLATYPDKLQMRFGAGTRLSEMMAYATAANMSVQVCACLLG